MPLDFSSETVPDFSDQTTEPIDFSAESTPAAQKPTRAAMDAEMSKLRSEWDALEAINQNLGSMVEVVTPLAGNMIPHTEKTIEQTASYIAGKPLEFAVSPTQVMEQSRELLPKIPQIPQQQGTAAQIGAGSVNAVTDFVNAMVTTPEGWATLGVGILPKASQKAVMTAFAAQMAVESPQQLQHAIDAAYAGDYQGAAKFATAGTGAAVLSATIARHALQKGPTIFDASEVRPVEPAVRDAGEVPAEALGFTPPGYDFLRKTIETFSPRSASDLPELRIEQGKTLPRLQPYEAEKSIASEPQGLARVPVLNTLDPRSLAKTPADEAILANAYSRAKGDAFGAIYAEVSSGKYGDTLKADAAGQITLADGSKSFMSDVFEAEMRTPGSQRLTPEQKSFVEDWRIAHREALEMLKEEKVKGFEVDEAGEFLNINEKSYFPRIATGVRGGEASGAAGGQRVGAKQFYQRQRDYKTEREGSERIIYEPDPVKRVATFISKVYKAVADTRLANDAALGGRVGKPRFGAEEAVHQPAFQGKAFPKATAQRLNEFYGDSTPTWLRNANSVSQASKALTFTADMSAPLNQGLVIAFSNPTKWAKATGKSWQALVEPKALSRYLSDNAALASEFVQSGGTIRRMSDFLAGAEKGTKVTKIPFLGKVIERTGRSFETFLDVAKIELWKAYRDVTPKQDWPRAIETIENMVLSGRQEQIGLTPSRAMAERLLLNAPSYYRAGVGLIATALRDGRVSGKMARRALISFTTGLFALHYGIYKMLGLDNDDILQRLNPASGKFMKVPITLSTGEGLEVGFSNFILRLMRLAGDTIEEVTNDKPAGLGLDNFFVKFLRGTLGPIPGFGSDVVTGTDPTGKEITPLGAALNRMRPISAQPMSDKEASTGEKLTDAAFSFFGLNAFEQSHRQLFFNERDRISKATYGKDYEDLGILKQVQITRRLQGDKRFQKPEATVREKMMALKSVDERRDRIFEQLTDENKKKIADLGVSITAYRPEIRIGRQDLPLTVKQQERYEQLIVDGYNAVIEKLPNTLTNLPIDRREQVVHGLLATQKRAAQMKLISENR